MLLPYAHGAGAVLNDSDAIADGELVVLFLDNHHESAVIQFDFDFSIILLLAARF